MGCYNSELPIGPPGPTGPQGPIGPCCITRVLNDTTTTALNGVLNTQVLNLSLEENGQFIEVQFDVFCENTNDYSSLVVDLNGYDICNIALSSDISGLYQGTIVITKSTSTTVNIRSELFGYMTTNPIIDLNLSNKHYFRNKLDHTTTPNSLVLTISTDSNVGPTRLTTSKILKYTLPYI